MLYRRLLLLWIAVSGVIFSFSQQPLFKQIGNNDILRGIEIYGIAQDLTHNIWLTTSNGVYRYDGLTFKNYKNEKLGGNDFFQPTITANGRLYFTTIAGNIYTLEDDEIELFKENDVPNSKEYTSLISSENYLYTISDDSIYQIDTLGNRVCIFGYPDAFARLQYKNHKSSNELTLFTNGLHFIIRINGGDFTIQKNQRSIFDTSALHSDKYILIDGKPKFYTRAKDHEYFHYTIDEYGNSKPSMEKDNIGIWYTCGNKNKWIVNSFQEGLKFTSNGAQNHQEMFSDFTISYIFEDIEGNIWIGTKNNGLILISNVQNFLLPTEEPAQGIDISFNSIISFSSNKTYVLNPKNNSVKSISNHNAISNVHLIADKKNRNSFYLQNSEGLQHYKNLKFYSNNLFHKALIKKHHWYNDSVFLLSGNNGAHLINPSNDNLNLKISPLNVRSIDAIWVSSAQKYFVASSKGLASCFKNGHVHQYVTFKGTPLDIQLLFNYRNHIYAFSTSGKVYKINSLTYQTEFITEIDKNYLVSGVMKDANIYLIDKQKLFVFNCKRNKVKELPIQLSPNMQLTGGVIYENVLWMSTNKGFLYYSLLNSDDKQIPNLYIEIINNKLNTEVKQYSFSHKQNHFTFRVRNRDFKHHGLSKIHYQLVGSDNSPVLISTNKGDIEYKSLSPGRYTFKAQIINPLGYTSEWQEYGFVITPPYWQSWWFLTLSALILISIITSFTTLRQRAKNVKRELERRLIESELTAIKAQMNPHFIFNCLNSIQDLILKQDVRASNRYLGLFSDLVRKTMEDSSKESVELSRELNLLNLYLNLEKLRFVDLNYKIVHSFSEEELDHYAIPPMLVQPFIENALKHGLLHLSGKKKLEVEVFRQQDALVFKIKDNGIGLEEGMKIKRRQSKYRSFSGDAISKRIELINSEGLFNVNFEIFDFSSSNNDIWNTIVELRFKKYFNSEFNP